MKINFKQIGFDTLLFLSGLMIGLIIISLLACTSQVKQSGTALLKESPTKNYTTTKDYGKNIEIGIESLGKNQYKITATKDNQIAEKKIEIDSTEMSLKSGLIILSIISISALSLFFVFRKFNLIMVIRNIIGI
jgi:hypothetical protein